jgi:hypothetical protein
LNKYKDNIAPETSKPQVQMGEQTEEMLNKASNFSFFIPKDNLKDLMPPILMGVALIVVYISLSHFHVKSLREKEEIKGELNELRSEYISVKSHLMKESNQSAVAKRLSTIGINELRTPPIIIEVKPTKK